MCYSVCLLENQAAVVKSSFKCDIKATAGRGICDFNDLNLRQLPESALD